ncbi:MAG: hypothetical protein FWC11_04045 [Firmicutes bacterium]|nr:hypothetical protein [Bacillota bacterium]MCL2256013.1 hypothetical protein [Bacillota bacterium]
MSFEPTFEASRFDNLMRISSSQAIVEARLKPVNGTAIARVLSVSSFCSVSPSETFLHESRYSGRVNFKVIYACSEGKNHALDYNADFSDKVTSEMITTDTLPLFSASIIDTDIVSVDEREIKLASVVLVNLDAVQRQSIDILTHGGEGVYTHEDKFNFSRLCAETKEEFTISDNTEFVGNVSMLGHESKIILASTRSQTDSCILEGKIVSDIFFEDEEGQISQKTHITNFTHEAGAIGASDNATMLANLVIKESRMSLESDSEKSALIMEFEVSSVIKAFEEQSISHVSDVFSVSHELVAETKTLDLRSLKFRTLIADRVDGQVTLDKNSALADTICAISGQTLNITSTRINANRIDFEGLASCNVVYFSQDTGTKNSVSVELPFSFSANAQVVESNEILVKGHVVGVQTKIRRGNEIDIKADIEIEVDVIEKETRSVITALKLGVERVIPSSAFSIHIARNGETLWEVAKSLGTTPELVLTQNPKLTLPLNGGERVIAYRHLK